MIIWLFISLLNPQFEACFNKHISEPNNVKYILHANLYSKMFAAVWLLFDF